MVFGIRREDKNKWEKRTPLIPQHIEELKEKDGLKFIAQPSGIRCYSDSSYQSANAKIAEDLSGADIILAIKEVPAQLILSNKTYLFFSHTFKGQKHNMPLLKKLMDEKCTLIDYEKILNEKGMRQIFFGNYAGYAGMIDSLNLIGEKLKLKGIISPLTEIKRAFEYPSLEVAMKEISEVGEKLKVMGMPKEITPLTFGFLGYGNVSKGAQAILDLLPVVTISPDALSQINGADSGIYKIVFKEEDLVERKDGGFELNEYFTCPEKYISKFDIYLPYLSVVVNCIFWSSEYPRFVTKNLLRELMSSGEPKLFFVADISCDIDGAIEITHKITTPDEPVFTYLIPSESFIESMEKDGISVLAIDNLPCELPIESSTAFSTMLKPFVVDISKTDFSRDFEDLEIHPYLKNAIIVYKGELTEKYKYLKNFIED